MPHNGADFDDKFWLMVTDWIDENVPLERTLYRIEYLRMHILVSKRTRHQHDAMNYIIIRTNAERTEYEQQEKS